MKTDHKSLILASGRPRLVDTIRLMLRNSDLSIASISSRFGISKSAVEDILYDNHCPSADVCLRIYEDLSGRPLLLIEQALAKENGPH